MKGQYIRSTNGAKGSENPICILSSSQPIYQKLSWINRVFTSENVLSYAPNINEYLTSLEKRFGPLKDWWDKWPRNEVSFIEHLKFHKRAKAKVGSFLEKPIEGLLAVQFNLLGLGLKLGWYDSSEKKVIQRRLLGDLFSTNLTLEEKDFVCSLENIQMDLELEDLPQDKWNRYTIAALGCFQPSSEEVHMALVQALTDPSRAVRGRATWALGKIKPQSLKVLLFITELLKHEDRDVRAIATMTLGEIKHIIKEEIHMALAQALTDPSRAVRESAAWALGKIKHIIKEEIHMALAQALTDPSRLVRESAARALGKIKHIINEEVHMALAQALTDPDWLVRESAAWALGEIKPQSLKVLLFITELLKHEERYVRANAAWALGKIEPQSLEVLEVIKLYNLELYQKIIDN